MKKKWKSEFAFEKIEHYIRLGFYIHFDPEEKYGGFMTEDVPEMDWYGKEFFMGVQLFKYQVRFSLIQCEDKEES